MEDITPSIPVHSAPVPPIPPPQPDPPQQQNGISTNGAGVNNPSPLNETVPQRPTPPPASSAKQSPPPASSSHKPTPPPQGDKPLPTAIYREAREKKDSWKKKEAKEVVSKPLPVPPPSTTAPLRLRPPPYRQEDINATPRLPTFTPVYTTTTLTGDQPKEFYRVSDQPFNKKKFRYIPCKAAPEMPQIMYTQISLPPHCARINWQDMSPYILIDKEGLSVTTEKGYRMARTNICIREGEWYVEFKIERGGGDQGGHTRVGFVRRESIPPFPIWPLAP
jgi:COMPASS component BRE2